MIIEIVPNSSPYNAPVGNAYKVLGPSVPNFKQRPTNDICICDFVDCEYIENVFGKVGGEDYQQDKTDFLLKRFISTDTVELKLLKNRQEIAVLDDNTLGELIDGFPEGTEEQQLYYYYLLDWTLVLQNFGSGYYSVEITLNVLGSEIKEESRTFFLLPFDDLSADATVKIESFQNGNIIGSQFDYTGLNLYQSIRIPGRFGNPTPEYETSRYITQQQEFKQIKDTMSRVWDLNTYLISWEVAEKLIYNKLLSNRILISDYNIKAESVWRQVSVRLQEIEKPEIALSPNKRYNIKFVDNEAIFQKRNF